MKPLNFGGDYRNFYDLTYPGLLHFPLTCREAENLRLASGFGQRPDDPRIWGTAAHPIARAAFILSFHKAIQKWALRTARPCYMVTIISDKWPTSRGKPRIDIHGMTETGRNALEAIGFEGLLSWEVQGIRSQAKDLHPHFHGIISPKANGALPEESARQRLSELFPDVDGADGVSMKRCRDSNDIVHFMMYAVKSPDTVKRIYKKASSSPARIREGRTGYSSRFACDILQIRSATRLYGTVAAHGKEFKKLKIATFRAAKTTIEKWGISLVPHDLPQLARDWRRADGRRPCKAQRPSGKGVNRS